MQRLSYPQSPLPSPRVTAWCPFTHGSLLTLPGANRVPVTYFPQWDHPLGPRAGPWATPAAAQLLAKLPASLLRGEGRKRTSCPVHSWKEKQGNGVLRAATKGRGLPGPPLCSRTSGSSQPVCHPRWDLSSSAPTCFTDWRCGLGNEAADIKAASGWVGGCQCLPSFTWLMAGPGCLVLFPGLCPSLLSPGLPSSLSPQGPRANLPLPCSVPLHSSLNPGDGLDPGPDAKALHG